MHPLSKQSCFLKMKEIKVVYFFKLIILGFLIEGEWGGGVMLI
jgi:hypothetical protein